MKKISFKSLVKENSASMVAVVGIWVAAGILGATGFNLSNQAIKGYKAQTQAASILSIFNDVKIISKDATANDYAQIGKLLESRFEGLVVKASERDLTIEVKAVADYSIFEQALALVAGNSGGLIKFEAIEICTGENACGGSSYRAVLKAKSWGVSP